MITNTIINRKVITVTTPQREPEVYLVKKTLVEYNEFCSTVNR